MNLKTINQTRRESRVTKKGIPNDGSQQRAFTFIDLMTVLGVVVLGIVLVLPVMGRTTVNGSAIQCINNLRQLANAWTIYTGDNAGNLIESHPWELIGGSRAAGTINPYCWAPGYAGTNPPLFSGLYSPSFAYSSTNPAGLTTSTFYKYHKDVKLYHCPSDRRTYSNPAGTWPLVRSYSMNNWFNGVAYDATHTLFAKDSQIKRPSTTWVLIDEDGLTLEDAMYITFMDGQGWLSVPSRRHNFGFPWTFADGHVEMFKINNPALKAASTAPTAGSRIPDSTSDYTTFTNRTTY